MPVRATGINPDMLRWARERAGYSVEQVASRRKVSPETVQQWEQGKRYPTWRQLEDLAHKDYHRATGFFFFDTPPNESTVEDEFRQLPSKLLETLEPDTLYAVRQARIRQADLRMLLGRMGSGRRFLLAGLRGKVNTNDPVGLATAVRERLEVALDEQKDWPSADEALEQWREMVEETGVWVFKRAFAQEDVAGFCLSDPVYPVIYLNSGQSKIRQVFTLFDELAHLLFGLNHLRMRDPEYYLKHLDPDHRAIEVACNHFAGIFLDPSGDFTSTLAIHESAIFADDYLAGLSRNYKVNRVAMSGEPIYRIPMVSEGASLGMSIQDPAQVTNSGKGDVYYATQATYLGQKYLRTVFSAFDEGRIDEFQLAECLGVKGSSIDRLEQYAWA